MMTMLLLYYVIVVVVVVAAVEVLASSLVEANSLASYSPHLCVVPFSATCDSLSTRRPTV